LPEDNGLKTMDIEKIASGLAEIRKRRRIYWIACALFIPALIAAAILNLSNRAVVAVIFSCFFIYAFAFFRMYTSVSPKCQLHFHSPYWKWSDRCVNCGLRLDLKPCDYD
jgi:hypothetical protein